MHVAKSLVISLIEFAVPISKTQELLSKYGLEKQTSSKETEDWVAVQVYDQIWSELLQITQNQSLGWECGEKFDILSTGLLGYIIRHAPDVRTALIKITQYSQLLSNLVTYEVQPGEGIIQVNFSASKSWQQQAPEVVQQETERIMSFMIKGLSVLTGTHFRPVEFFFKRTNTQLSASTLDLETIAQKVIFNASHNAFSFTPEILSLPLVHQNDQLLQVLEGHAQQILTKLQANTFTDTIRQKIADYFRARQHFCQIEWVAEEMSLSVRTLQRRLKSENTAFTDVLEDIKLNFAKAYLKDESLAIAEVAFLLGYNEISAFYHFFKKHMQLTPRQFRFQH